MKLNKHRLLLIAAAIAVCVWLIALLPTGTPLTVTFLDVGDGLCVVAQTPSGKVIVFDCGTSSWRKAETIGEKLVAPYLQSLGIDTIDVAVLSHPHSDHLSGYAGLLSAKPAKMVMDIAASHTSPHYERFLHEVELCGADYKIARQGQRVDMGDGVVLEVLSPPAAKQHPDLNDMSVVLRLTYGEVSVLLTADAGTAAEDDILNSGLAVQAQVLQVGHHGSATASHPRWLKQVNPTVAVISCARQSRHGHPSQEVVNRLQGLGAQVYITGRDGAITAVTDGKTLEIRAVTP